MAQKMMDMTAEFWAASCSRGAGMAGVQKFEIGLGSEIDFLKIEGKTRIVHP
jgi:hypothetical protein